MRHVLAAAIVVTTACGAFGRPAPTLTPLLAASFLTVHLVVGDASDAQERARLPALRDSVAEALPNAWAQATGGRGALRVRTDADIEIVLDGRAGTSALTQHKRDGKVVSRSIVVHTVEGNRHLSLSEVLATTLHELGHIWCCFGPGTAAGHWSDAPPGFSTIGLMSSPIVCELNAGEARCPQVFSDRELAEMRLIAAP